MLEDVEAVDRALPECTLPAAKCAVEVFTALAVVLYVAAGSSVLLGLAAFAVIAALGAFYVSVTVGSRCVKF